MVTAATILASLMLSSGCAQGMSIIELPRYPPDIIVYRADGTRMLSKRAETEDNARSFPVKLMVNPRFRPKNERDAACELRAMLPNEYRVLVAKNRDEFRATGMMSNHRSEGRRLYDLAIYLERSWGDDWGSERDRVARVIDLLFRMDECDSLKSLDN